MEGVCPTVVEPLVRLWCALHGDLEFEWNDQEAGELRRTRAELEDELVAGLFEAKLRMSSSGRGSVPRQPVARAGSEVLYVRNGQEARARLVDGTVVAPGLLGTGSRFGAALVGLSPGQSLLWPDERWELVEIRALEVKVPKNRWWQSLGSRLYWQRAPSLAQAAE